MSRSNHPIEQEELMAYLDGELATSRAVAAAAHLEHCAECQELAGDLRKLSQEMMAWEVEELESAEGTPIAIKAALQDRPGKPRKIKTRLGWRILLTRRGLVWAGGGTVVAVLLLMTFSVSPMRPVRMDESLRQTAATAKLEKYYESPEEWRRLHRRKSQRTLTTPLTARQSLHPVLLAINMQSLQKKNLLTTRSKPANTRFPPSR